MNSPTTDNYNLFSMCCAQTFTFSYVIFGAYEIFGRFIDLIPEILLQQGVSDTVTFSSDEKCYHELPFVGIYVNKVVFKIQETPILEFYMAKPTSNFETILSKKIFQPGKDSTYERPTYEIHTFTYKVAGLADNLHYAIMSPYTYYPLFSQLSFHRRIELPVVSSIKKIYTSFVPTELAVVFLIKSYVTSGISRSYEITSLIDVFSQYFTVKQISVESQPGIVENLHTCHYEEDYKKFRQAVSAALNRDSEGQGQGTSIIDGLNCSYDKFKEYLNNYLIEALKTHIIPFSISSRF